MTYLKFHENDIQMKRVKRKKNWILVFLVEQTRTSRLPHQID